MLEALANGIKATSRGFEPSRTDATEIRKTGFFVMLFSFKSQSVYFSASSNILKE